MKVVGSIPTPTEFRTLGGPFRDHLAGSRRERQSFVEVVALFAQEPAHVGHMCCGLWQWKHVFRLFILHSFRM